MVTQKEQKILPPSNYARPILFFLKSDASEIGVTVIHHMHASGVKARAESNQICNKRWLFIF